MAPKKTKMTEAERQAAVARIKAERLAKWEAALERVRAMTPSQRYEAGGAMREDARTERVDIFNPMSEESVYRRGERASGQAASERSGVQYARSGRVARTQSFPRQEETGRTIAAKAAIAKRGEEVTDEALEYELQKTDVPSAKANPNPAPFWKDSQVRPERPEVVSRQQVQVYTCDCGKTIDRAQNPVCLCKVSSGKLFETREQTRRRARRQQDRAAANQAVVTAYNETEANLKASLSVQREAVKGQGARPALLTEDREMARIAQRSGYEILREQFEKAALKADILESKLREDEEAGKLPIGVRENLRRSIAKIRKKANELREMAESQKRYGTEAQVFKLSGADIGLGLGSLVVAGLGLFLVYRTFQAPTA